MEEEDHTVSQDSNGSSVAESAASLPAEADCSAAQSFAGLAVCTTDCFECGSPLHGPYCLACNPEIDAGAELMPLLASAWFYGGFRAETETERRMQAIMERCGWWPIANEAQLIAALQDAALSHQQPHDQIREGEG